MKDQDQEGFIVSDGYSYGVAVDDNCVDYVLDRFCAAIACVFSDAAIEFARSVYMNRLLPAYSEETRFHHNLSHIAHVFREIDGIWQSHYAKYYDMETQIDIIETAIIAAMYHDCVYVPGSRLNEFLSAKHAIEDIRQYVRRGDERTTVEKTGSDVVEAILATGASSCHVFDTTHVGQILHDADFSILGATQKQYTTYVENVKREYLRKIPEKEWIAGRKLFLAKLNTNEVFCTQHFSEKYRNRCYANISTELNSYYGGSK